MSTTLSELIDLVMLESGEFILDQLDNTLIVKNQFWLLTKRVLGVYSKYKMFEVKANVTTNSGLYTYSASSTYGIPEWISSVIPVNITDVYQLYADTQLARGQNISEYGLLDVPRPFYWEYSKPNLRVYGDGTFDVTEQYKHIYVVIEDDSDNVTEVAFSTISIDDDEQFIDLLTAKFLQSVGRSRRMFTLNDLPISNDSSELVSEGQELWDKTIEDLQGHSDWWKGVGGI